MRISVIIPCYNPDIELLKRALESVIVQKYQDFEILIIDDGSKNHDEIADMVRLDSRIIIITQENKGVSSARNLGVENASGDYVTFLDADDCVSPYFFEEAISIITDYDFLIGGVVRKKELPVWPNYKEGKVLSYSEKKSRLKRHLLVAVDPISFENSGYIGRGPWARIIKTSLARKVPFDTNLPIYEDFLWNIQVVNKASKIGVVKAVWYFYYDNTSSVINTYNPSIVSIYEYALNCIKSELVFPDEKKTFYDLILEDLQNIYYFKFVYEKFDRKAYTHIYTSEPWNSILHYKSVGKLKGKRNIRLFGYCFRCYYEILKIKDTFKKKIKELFVKK